MVGPSEVPAPPAPEGAIRTMPPGKVICTGSSTDSCWGKRSEAPSGSALHPPDGSGTNWVGRCSQRPLLALKLTTLGNTVATWGRAFGPTPNTSKLGPPRAGRGVSPSGTCPGGTSSGRPTGNASAGSRTVFSSGYAGTGSRSPGGIAGCGCGAGACAAAAEASGMKIGGTTATKLAMRTADSDNATNPVRLRSSDPATRPPPPRAG